MVLTAELTIEEASEYRRREARSLKKESQSSLTSLAGAEVDFARTAIGDGDTALACGRESRFSVAVAGRAVVELRRVSCLDAIRGVVWWMGRRAPASEGAAGFSRPRDMAVRMDMLMGLAFILGRSWN